MQIKVMRNIRINTLINYIGNDYDNNKKVNYTCMSIQEIHHRKDYHTTYHTLISRL